MLFPVEIAAVDDDAADRIAVPADILRRRIHHDSGAVIERSAQNWRRGVVEDQRHAELAPDSGDLGNWEHLELRVRQSLGVIAAGALVGCTPEILGIGRIDKTNLHPHRLHHRIEEQVPGPAIEVGGADEIVARLADVLNGEQRGGLARGESQRSDAAIEGGDALLEHRGGRVHDAGIDVAELGQTEQIGGMLAVAELIAGRLVDRDRDGVGRRVAPVPRMEHECFGMLALGRHSNLRGRAPGRHFAMTGAAGTAGFRLCGYSPAEWCLSGMGCAIGQVE